MFTVCVGLVFCSKYAQFPIICSLQYSININTVEVYPPLRFTAYLHSETQELVTLAPGLRPERRVAPLARGLCGKLLRKRRQCAKMGFYQHKRVKKILA